MITSFILAFALIAISVGLLTTLDKATSLATGLFRTLLRFTHRSKLLTEYVLRAYLRYRKVVQRTQYRAL